LTSVHILENGILGVEEGFYVVHRERDFDPILRGAVAQVGSFDAKIKQPFVNELQCVVCGLDEIIYLGFAQVLTISVMSGIRNYPVVSGEMVYWELSLKIPS
jgi:hypothetical protein